MYLIARYVLHALVVLGLALPDAAQGDYGFLWWAHGCRGKVVRKLRAGGVEVIQYEWPVGVATVKGDVLVKWKPS